MSFAEKFEFKNESSADNTSNETIEEKLKYLRKKQIDCIAIPENMTDLFLELTNKETEGTINNIDKNRLKLMREKYWTPKDQEELLELTDNEKRGGEKISSEELERFHRLTKKQTNDKLTEDEREEIQKYYKKL